jgi:hypothetical protein
MWKGSRDRKKQMKTNVRRHEDILAYRHHKIAYLPSKEYRIQV